MKLSVMITTYNLENYIQETLESVLMQQTDFDYEILIGDDGSQDGTIAIARSYEQRCPDKIHLYIMERDADKKYNRIARASKNRINLLSHAKGEYLIFLDGDDVYTDTQKLQKQVDILDAPANRDCAACAHNICLYWNEDRKELVNPYKKRFKVSGRTYWRDCMYFHSDTVMFRNIFQNGFPQNVNPAYYDDNIIVYVLLEAGKLIYIPDVMVNYRQVENSSWNSVDEVEKNLINLMDWDIERQIHPSYYKESRMRHMYNILSVFLRRNTIPKEVREKYLAQIQRDNLTQSRQWLLFKEQSAAKRLTMTFWLIGSLFIFTWNKIRKTIAQKKY